MKMPTTVKVGPFDYAVEASALLDCLGETFCDELVIRLKLGMPRQTMEETFFHELFHAVNHVYCNRSLDEEEIRQMSIGLYQVLKDNGFLKEK